MIEPTRGPAALRQRGSAAFGWLLLATIAVLAAGAPASAAWDELTRPVAAATTSQSQTSDQIGVPKQRPGTGFGQEPASGDVRELAAWVVESRDNRTMPFVIIDKVNAKVFVFDRAGALRGATAALLGVGRGDDSVVGIGQRKLATITPAERTTPAGRFEAALGHDFDQDILWIDYEAALSLHRVIAGNRKDRRAERLASATVSDNRISFGCINVPAAFYDDVVAPAFTATVGIVYILPETKPLRAVFPMPQPHPSSASSVGAH